MKEVVLFSGGPDSLIAWEYLKRPDALYIQHGCRYEYKQLEAVEKIAVATNNGNIIITDKVLDLSQFESEDAHLPLRNMYFSMIAANMGYVKIWLVTQKGEQSIPDRSSEFLERISRELSIHMERTVHVDCIFPQMTKQDMVKWYVDEGLDLELLKATVSCFHPDYRMCGECPACFRRWIAFEYNGIHEKYRKDLTKWTGTQEYVKKLKNGEYDEDRTKQTLEVLERFSLI